MVSKTREKLIEVARQLFARKGIENTTMNDIAAAGGKGRRTLYTYFKSKVEIYNAVIERESEQLVTRLRQVESSSLAPADKLRRYFEVRFEIVSDAVQRSEPTLKGLLSGDIRRIDKIRRIAISKEIEIFKALLIEGVRAGVFDPKQAERAIMMETVVFQGVDYSYLRNNFKEIGVNRVEMRRQIVDYIVNSLVINR